MYYLVSPCSIIGHTFQLICSVLRTGEVHQENDGVDGDSKADDELEQAHDQSEDAAAESCDPSPSLVRGQCAAGKSSLPSILIHRTGGIPSFYFKFLLKFIVKQSINIQRQGL